MHSVRAFAPGDMTCLFKVVSHSDPEKMHSLGLSFTIEHGVVAQASESAETCITFNDQQFPFPTIEKVITSITEKPVNIHLETPLPLSCGFGLSGASALATAYAVNELFSCGFSEAELALKAHVAEVEQLTGLGDVCVQYNGGCCARFTPGVPLEAHSVPVAEQPIYYRYFSALRTDEVLGDKEQRARINAAADTALAAVQHELSTPETLQFSRIIDISYQFAHESGLLRDPQTRDLVENIRQSGGHASMIMLGNAVFSLTPFPECEVTSLSRRSVHVLTDQG